MSPDNNPFTETAETIADPIFKALSRLYPQWHDRYSVLMKQRFRSANIIFFDRNEEHSIRIPVIGDHTLLTEICVKKNNQTIDFVPVLRDSQIIKIQPVLLMDKQASRFTVIHELCHLLSLGDYVISGNEITHRFGTLSYRYRILDGKVIKTEEIGNKTENEKITNTITENIMRCIDGDIIDAPESSQAVLHYFIG